MKKVRSNNLISLGIIILGIVLLAGWYIFPKLVPEKSKNEYDNLSNALKSYGSELSALEEIHNFPIYPGAKFIKKEETLPCPTPLISGYTDCGSTAYKWGVNEDTAKVQNWYSKESVEKMEWNFLGGAGSIGSITQSNLINQKDNFKINLIIVSNNSLDENVPKPIYRTILSVLLPK